MKRLSLGLSTLVLLALVGCTPAAQTAPESTPTPSDTVVPSPTPSVDPADPTAWTFGFGSVGPLRVGGTIADAGSALESFTVTRQDACPWLVILDNPQVGSLAVPVGDDDVIDQLVVWQSATLPPEPLATAAGIAQGSTEEDLLAAYPGITGVQGGNGETDYSVADGSGYFLNFSVSSGVVSSVVTRDSANIDSEYCG